MSAPRPYTRPIDPQWWARPPYLAYTVREAAGAAIALYALILLWGVIALARGPAAYEAWLGFLRSPLSLLLHVILLAAMLLHVWTWFRIMPKTMPRLVIGGQYVPQARITAGGLAAAAAGFIVVLLLALWVRP